MINDFEVAPDDPAAEFLAGHGSLVAIPLLDQGVALNMVVHLRREPAAFDPEMLPEHVWTANLFGRATNSLVLAGTVKTAYEEIDRELKAVAAIQRSLLPAKLPELSSLKLAAHYETARRAGGDYYDFIPLPGGLLGILIADVSGHGTPAAVMMAVMHSIVHNYPGEPAAAEPALGLPQSEAGAALRRRERDVRDRVLRNFRPGDPAFDLFLRRS